MLTCKQRVEWMAFTKIRGPIGGDRDAYNIRYLAQHTRLSAVHDLKFGPGDFRHPWEPEIEVPEEHHAWDDEDD